MQTLGKIVTACAVVGALAFGVTFVLRNKNETGLLPGFSDRTTWRDKGTQTPEAAFETHCWAIVTQSTEVLLTTIEISPEVNKILERTYAKLEPKDKARFESPQRMLGMLWARTERLPFRGMAIQGREPASNGAVAVKVSLQYDSQAFPRTFFFRQSGDGWRKVSPEDQIAEILTRSGYSI